MIKKLRKFYSLYASLFGCLLLASLISGCATPAPYQQMSEAKQALMMIEKLTNQKPLTPTDAQTYQQAQYAYQQAVHYLSYKANSESTHWVKRSLDLSQKLLKHYQPNNHQSNIHFRY